MMMLLVIPVEDLLAVNGVQELRGGCSVCGREQ